MSNNQYPLFETGETLTAADLNMLQAFLHDRDRLVGRMTGFGVNCGLGGVVTGTTLTIQPGLAVDQNGEPLVLADPATISLAPPVMTPSYDFIDTAPGGFSVVLESSETVVPAPDCGEADCAGHAELHTVGVTVRTVAGRVTGTRMDFGGESLLTVTPMGLSAASTPTASYNSLRDAIATRLTNGTNPEVKPDLIADLQATSIVQGESPGIQGYKCGWLNLVLFATLDLLRVEALLKVGCDRSTARAGVVLGWVNQVGGSWVFDCSYRHAWEPPRGFTEAFLGGTCTDPAALTRETLEALLAGYAPPDPAPAGGVDPPTSCPRGSIFIHGKCYPIFYPPTKLPDRWYDKWQIVNPEVPVWNPPPDETWKQPWTVYGTESWDFFGDGVIGVSDYVGRNGADVKNVLETYIGNAGGVADVKVVDAGTAQATPGYMPSGGFSPSDTIVLSVDNNGAVIATGRVAAARNTRSVGVALPAALDAAAGAQKAAGELSDLSASLQRQFQTLSDSVGTLSTNFGGLQSEFDNFKTAGFQDTAFGQRLGAVEQQVNTLSTLRDQITAVASKVDVLTKMATPGRAVTGVAPALGRGIADFAGTTIEAMRSLTGTQNPNFARHTAAAGRAHAEFEADVAAGDPDLIGRSALNLLSSMRTMVKASGASPAVGRQLDAQLRELGRLIQ
jgi:hypothetical protein